MSLSEGYDPRQKLRASALVLRAIVLKQEERIDLRKALPVSAPPRVELID
jgi:hypothetical protein